MKSLVDFKCVLKWVLRGHINALTWSNGNIKKRKSVVSKQLCDSPCTCFIFRLCSHVDCLTLSVLWPYCAPHCLIFLFICTCKKKREEIRFSANSPSFVPDPDETKSLFVLSFESVLKVTEGIKPRGGKCVVITINYCVIIVSCPVLSLVFHNKAILAVNPDVKCRTQGIKRLIGRWLCVLEQICWFERICLEEK